MTIADLKAGQNAIVKEVGGEGELRQHFLDMGVIPGAALRFVGSAPMGDPLKIFIHGYSLTLRSSEAEKITVEAKEGSDARAETEEHANFGYNLTLHEHNSHPGLGEGGKYHNHSDEKNALPKNETLSFALVGQQNSGKTTLFNQLTGSNQHVGNFPGVTVDRKDGEIRGYPNTLVTDLPGIYSLSPYTIEEIVSRDFILKSKPKAIINVVDAGNIERNLYLTLQLMELGVPMVLALNMMDEVRENGGSVRVNEMERILGIPVVPIAAATCEGVDELVKHAVHIARYREAPARQDFCDPEEFGGAVHRCIHSICHIIEDHAAASGIPARFAAEKMVEGDKLIGTALNLDDNEKETIEHIVSEMEKERGMDRAAAIAQMRFSFIERLCNETVVKPRESREYRRSVSMDRILTGRWTSIPIFIAVMVAVLYLSIDVIGSPLQSLLQNAIVRLGETVSAGMQSLSVSPAIQSLVVDAIFGGVGSVVSFVPVIVVIFFFLSLLEDSGYMARVAFVTDKIFRKLGLSGRSIVPLLIGFGCSVPAVMASRTLPSSSDRKRTIMLTPFISCSAKIPIYAFFAATFFPGKGGLVMASLYVFSILMGVVVALGDKFLGRRREPSPFVMELPNYRLPRIRNVGHLLWDKTKDFLQRAFTVIFLATLVIWLLQSFDFRLNLVTDSGDSMLATVSGWVAPVLNPIGLGDWRIVIALISGFLAKESIVSTMGVLGLVHSLTLPAAVSMMVFCLLYTPCIATIAAVRRELGGKWATAMVVFQCLVAWVMAFLAYNLVLLVI